MKSWTWRGITIVALLVALPVLAAIPDAGKVAQAVAETNETSGRDGALLLEVQLRITSNGPQVRVKVRNMSYRYVR